MMNVWMICGPRAHGTHPVLSSPLTRVEHVFDNKFEEEAHMESRQAVIPAAARTLLERCDAELVAGQFSSDPADRFLHAHFAALRAAGAVLESRGKTRVRGQSANVWQLLARHLPELAQWADTFAQSARFRVALESGRFDLVDDARADRLLTAAEDFRDAARGELGFGAFYDSQLQVLHAS